MSSALEDRAETTVAYKRPRLSTNLRASGKHPDHSAKPEKPDTHRAPETRKTQHPNPHNPGAHPKNTCLSKTPERATMNKKRSATGAATTTISGFDIGADSDEEYLCPSTLSYMSHMDPAKMERATKKTIDDRFKAIDAT